MLGHKDNGNLAVKSKFKNSEIYVLILDAREYCSLIFTYINCLIW